MSDLNKRIQEKCEELSKLIDAAMDSGNRKTLLREEKEKDFEFKIFTDGAGNSIEVPIVKKGHFNFGLFSTIWEYTYTSVESESRSRRILLGPTDVDEYLNLQEKLLKDDPDAIKMLFMMHNVKDKDLMISLHYDMGYKRPYIKIVPLAPTKTVSADHPVPAK